MTDTRRMIRLRAAVSSVVDLLEERNKQAQERERLEQERKAAAGERTQLRSICPFPIKPEEIDDLDKYDRDPVRAALRLGLRDLGRIAGLTLDLEQMQELAEAVASDRGRYGTRINIIDKGWNGVRCKGALWLS